MCLDTVRRGDRLRPSVWSQHPSVAGYPQKLAILGRHKYPEMVACLGITLSTWRALCIQCDPEVPSTMQEISMKRIAVSTVALFVLGLAPAFAQRKATI